MTTRRLLALASIALLAGCGPGQPPARVTYAIQHAQQTLGDCASPAGCTKITLRWPEVLTAPSDAGKDSLVRCVREALLRPYEGGPALASTDSVMAQFIEARRATAREFPESAGIPWTFERRIEIVGDTLGVVSLAVTESGFTGGAHPNATIQFTNLDTRTGHALLNSDLLRDRISDRLDSLGEQEFRHVRRIPPGQSINDAGFWFEGGRFHLTDNMAVTHDGLLFYFNDYEIGPHVLGATRVLLPWRDVKPLLKPDGPLGYQGT
jgi:hypothetical protein